MCLGLCSFLYFNYTLPPELSIFLNLVNTPHVLKSHSIKFSLSDIHYFPCFSSNCFFLVLKTNLSYCVVVSVSLFCAPDTKVCTQNTKNYFARIWFLHMIRINCHSINKFPVTTGSRLGGKIYKWVRCSLPSINVWFSEKIKARCEY